MPGMLWYFLLVILMFIGLFMAVPSDEPPPSEPPAQSSENLSTRF